MNKNSLSYIEPKKDTKYDSYEHSSAINVWNDSVSGMLYPLKHL